MRERGFTLLEIAIAIAFLGLSLSTIIAIQTRYLRQYSREENLAQAALYAQYAMTMMEVVGEPPETGSIDGDLATLLKETNFFDESELSAKEGELDGWKYRRNVTAISLPSLGETPPEEDVLRRIDLQIDWGGGDGFTLVYYMRTK